MKKKKIKFAAILASIIAIILSGVTFAVEGICAFTRNSMPVYITIWGGECGTKMGIGWSIFTVYPMSSTDNPVSPVSRVYFNPSIFAFFALVWMVVFGVTVMINRKKG